MGDEVGELGRGQSGRACSFLRTMGTIGFKLGSQVVAVSVELGVAVGIGEGSGRGHSTVYRTSLAPCSFCGTVGASLRRPRQNNQASVTREETETCSLLLLPSCFLMISLQESASPWFSR